MSWLVAAGAGVVGALVMTIMTDVSRVIGLIDANMSRYQGCVVTGRADGGRALAAGLAAHLAMGAVLALGYMIVFRVIGEATWWIGALIGVVHWVAAGLSFPLLDRMNPCVADGRLRGFGVMGRNYGAMMVIGLLAGHVVYGSIVGGMISPSPRSGPHDGRELRPVEPERIGAGDVAPDFTLRAHDGGYVTLSDHRGRRDVLLVFYRGHW